MITTITATSPPLTMIKGAPSGCQGNIKPSYPSTITLQPPLSPPLLLPYSLILIPLMRPKGELPTQPFNPPTPHKVISIHVAFNDCNGFLSQYMYNTIHGIWHILYTSSNASFFAISSHKCRSPIWTFSTTSSCWSFDYCWSLFFTTLSCWSPATTKSQYQSCQCFQLWCF